MMALSGVFMAFGYVFRLPWYDIRTIVSGRRTSSNLVSAVQKDMEVVAHVSDQMNLKYRYSDAPDYIYAMAMHPYCVTNFLVPIHRNLNPLPSLTYYAHSNSSSTS
jgi:hypothetical protein